MEINQILNLLAEKNGLLIENGISNEVADVQELVTDSRNLFNPENAMFFAIKNVHGNDGHEFIPELYNKGIRNFIVEYVSDFLKEKNDVNYIHVEDSVKALAVVGSSHRNNSSELVAIVGSRGKTTLKEILFQLLEPLTKISRSPRSYNSKIGVPLSLWQIPINTELSLIEAGISRKDEMEFLASIINPDTVIFTNIGDAHAEGFSSKREKAEEKTKMAAADNVKKIIYPSDDPLLAKCLIPFNHNKEIIGWSIIDQSAPLFLQISESDSHDGKKRILYTWENEQHDLEIEVLSSYDIENIAGALAYMLSAGYPHEVIKHRFSFLHSISTRMNVSDGINGCTIIADSYTSDYSSLIPAIDFMRRRRGNEQTLTLILSDIRHETENLDETYKKIGSLVKDSGVNRFIGIGSELVKHKEIFPANSLFFTDTENFLSQMSASDFVNEIILLKGAPEFSFNDIFRQLEARKHETVLEVNLDALVRNYNYFRSMVPQSTGIIAMVKAFGYGAGSYEIAKTLQDCGAAYLAVAVLDEGIDLRRNGIMMPIMVMNPRSMNYKAMFENRLQPVVYSKYMLEEMVREIEKNGTQLYPVHIKLDTGMHRMGFMEDEIPELIRILRANPSLKVESVFSHLATADCLDMDDFTIRQLRQFERMSKKLTEVLPYYVQRHILNSAGIIRFPQYHYDMVRLGIGLYGANTLPPDIEKPLSVVASLKTVIICVREIETDEAVGYSRKGLVKRPSKIATLPVGYADGIDRRLGNGNLKVMLKGNLAPTIGNICMDAMMIDVTGIDCQEGDEVEIFGNNLSLQDIAETLGTIPYEILTSVSLRVKRNYYRE